MSIETNTIGSFEAKSKLSELLRETEKGSSFVILRRGKPVARLVPIDHEIAGEDMTDLVASFQEIRKKIRKKVNTKKLVEEGRRC